MGQGDPRRQHSSRVKYPAVCENVAALAKNRSSAMKRILSIFVCAAMLGLASRGNAQTLASVKARGILNCGANPGLGGFALPDAQGNWAGLDVDFCRAVAAAIFDDPK